MGQKVIPIRVVIDTNVLLSGFLFGGEPSRLREYWITGSLLPLLSKETFSEFRRVLSYPKFCLSSAEIQMLIEEELLPYADVLDVTYDASGICRDPKDDKFLSLAVSGKAVFIITGDQDLLVLQSIKKTKIVMVSEILEIMKKS